VAYSSLHRRTTRHLMETDMSNERISIELAAKGTCRIGKSGTKAHPANLMIETFADGRVVKHIYRQCSCAAYGYNDAANKAHTFVKDGTATCKNSDRA
jgi:hypothetical protein